MTESGIPVISVPIVERRGYMTPEREKWIRLVAQKTTGTTQERLQMIVRCEIYWREIGEIVRCPDSAVSKVLNGKGSDVRIDAWLRDPITWQATGYLTFRSWVSLNNDLRLVEFTPTETSTVFDFMDAIMASRQFRMTSPTDIHHLTYCGQTLDGRTKWSDLPCDPNEDYFTMTLEPDVMGITRSDDCCLIQ